MTEVSFPGLFDHVFHINRYLPFTIFGQQIAWYGVIILTAFIFLFIYGNKRIPQFGADWQAVTQYVAIAFPTSLFGARAYYVIYQWDEYKDNLSSIFQISSGGLAIYGMVIACLITLPLYQHFRKDELLHKLDLGSICVMAGQAAGRWGNFINGEAFGTQTNLPWGMSIGGAAPVHPCFLYESVWNFCGAIALHFYSRHQKFRGEIVLWYFVWYGAGRSWIEGLRTDSLYIWNTNIRVSQLFAFCTFIFGASVLIYCYTTKKWPRPYISPINGELLPADQRLKKKGIKPEIDPETLASAKLYATAIAAGYGPGGVKTQAGAQKQAQPSQKKSGKKKKKR